MNHAESTKLRLSLLERGFEPIPTRYKICPSVGWSKWDITPELIEKYDVRAQGTGLRSGKTVPVDEDVEEDLQEAVRAIVEEVAGPNPYQRMGRRPMSVYRAAKGEAGTKKISTGRWEKGDRTATVEILGKGQQFVAYGPHSKGREYTWPVKDLDRLEDLPEITVEQRKEIISRCEALFAERGYTRATKRSLGRGFKVDGELDGGMVFDTKDYGPMTVDQIEQMLRQQGGHVRACCSAVRGGARNPESGLFSILDGDFILTDFGEDRMYKRRLEPLPKTVLPPMDMEGTPGPRDIDFIGCVDMLALPDVVMAKDGPYRTQLPTDSNVNKVLELCRVEPRWDIMSRRVDIPGFCRPPEIVWAALLSEFMRAGIKDPRTLELMIDARAKESPFHPMAEWVKSKPWDGRTRLKKLTSTVQCVNQLAWEIYFKRWSIQAMQAVFGWDNPQQVGYTLVMAGAQGIGKSTWFSNLVPKEFFMGEAHLALNAHGKDSREQATSRPIVELGELDGSFKRSDTSALKAFLSAPWDTYRASYARRAETYPRATVFCATVNNPEVLVDDTGSRRFWLVEAKSIEHDVDVDMQQYWAEVYEAWKAGEGWNLTAEENAVRIEEESHFTMVDPIAVQLDEILGERLRHPATDQWSPMNSYAIATTILHIEKPQNWDLRKISQWMKKATGRNNRTINGVRKAWMVPPLGKPPKLEAVR